MATSSKPYVINNIAGGRNGFLPPWQVPEGQCVDAVNVDFYRTPFARKRGGMLNVTTAGSNFTGTISSLFRHVPGQDQTAAELWGIDDAATNVVGRMAASTAFANPSLKDNPTGNGYDWTASSINGKLILAYKSALARLHLWDGSTVRRSGLAAMAAPTISDTGGGAYVPVVRYYRTRATVQVASVTVRRSEPTTGVSFTPVGTGTAARVTQGTVPNEGETHWEVEASIDNVSFYRIATVVIATTTYDDSAATTSYASNPLSALTGVYTLFPSCKFVAADQNRVLGFADWTSTGKQSRLYISAVIGSLDVGDEERIDTSAVNYYLDFDESDSGVPTALAGPALGAFFVFKDRRTWSLTATGQTSLPYRVDNVSKDIGAVNQNAIARGEDAAGNSALYWMSHRGPYRYSAQSGLEYIGQGVEDYVLTGTLLNLAATKVVARTIYYPDLRQVWFWWATGSSNDPNQCFKYDVQTGGFSRVPTGDKAANVRCAVMFSNTLGATMSLDLKPYVGESGSTNQLSKMDTGTDDRGTTFQAYVVTRDVEVGGPNAYGDIDDCSLIAKAASGVTITLTVTPEFGAIATDATTCLLTAAGSEARVVKRFEDSAYNGGNAGFYNFTVGDGAAISNAWTLERLVVPLNKLQSRT